MGGDGGVIANKRKFVRGCRDGEEAKSAEQTAKQQTISKSKFCAMSSEPLVQPIVACELGNLFNKEAILTALLNKSLPTTFSHIRGLKDLKQLILTCVPEYHDGGDLSQFKCPVTQVEFNGIQPFVVLWNSGWVLSESAIRELGIQALTGEYGSFT